MVTTKAGVLSVTATGYSGVYDGKTHGLTVTSNGATIKYSTDNKTYSSTKPTYMNVGTYTVYYEVSKTGYTTVTGSKQVIISKASGSVVAPTAKTLTYTGNAQSLINAGSSSTGTIQYKLEGGSYSTSIPTATNVGTYKVYYKVVGDSNHNDVAEASISVTIGKASNTLTLSSSSGNYTYPTSGTFTVTKNLSGGTLTCTSSNTNVATCSISGNTITVTPGTTKGTATLTIKSATTTSYKEGQATYVVTTKAGVLSVTATGYSGVYDGTPHGITVTSSGATIKYGTSSGSYTLTSSPTYIEAGTYTVYYEVTKPGYTTVTGSKDVVIKKLLSNIVKLGDYVKYVPTATSYTPDTTLSGCREVVYCNQGSFNPSELTIWRVIHIYDDGRIEIVSDNISSESIYIYGKTGYINYVKVLNDAAKSYLDNNYAQSARAFGYYNQTEVITNLSALNSTTPPWTTSTNSSILSYENIGAGDLFVLTDRNKLTSANIDFSAKNNSGVTDFYWTGSRMYNYSSTGLSPWSFNGMVLGGAGLTNYSLYGCNSTNTCSSSIKSAPIRPIVTLKSGISITGSGTIEDPYVLN